MTFNGRQKNIVNSEAVSTREDADRRTIGCSDENKMEAARCQCGEFVATKFPARSVGCAGCKEGRFVVWQVLGERDIHSSMSPTDPVEPAFAVVMSGSLHDPYDLHPTLRDPYVGSMLVADENRRAMRRRPERDAPGTGWHTRVVARAEDE